MRTSFLIALLVLSACNQPNPQYVGPAPAGALDCALAEAKSMGYERMGGWGADSSVRVSQRAPFDPSRVDPNSGPPLGDLLPQLDPKPPTENQLVFREQDGRLHIQVVSVFDERVIEPSPEADSHARRILAACTGP